MCAYTRGKHHCHNTICTRSLCVPHYDRQKQRDYPTSENQLFQSAASLFLQHKGNNVTRGRCLDYAKVQQEFLGVFFASECQFHRRYSNLDQVV